MYCLDLRSHFCWEEIPFGHASSYLATADRTPTRFKQMDLMDDKVRTLYYRYSHCVLVHFCVENVISEKKEAPGSELFFVRRCSAVLECVWNLVNDGVVI